MHCVMVSLEQLILKGLSNAASALEGQVTIEIPQETILEVVEAIVAVESKSVRVNWID